MTNHPVSLRIAPDPGLVSLLRSAVRVFAAREDFTIDQVDDVRMAVEEAAVALLKTAAGDHIELTMGADESGVEMRVGGDVADGVGIDETSFSWTILTALTDEVAVEAAGARCTVVMRKHRAEGVARRDSA